MVISGVLSVMTVGASAMLRWCANSYISQVQMPLWVMLRLGKEPVLSGWTMFCVLAVSNNCQNVLIALITASEITTVTTSRMLV